MPRSQRLDFRGAIHSIDLLGRGTEPIFFATELLRQPTAQIRGNAPRVRAFESFLARACDECDALLYAYVIVPNAAVLVLRTDGAPLEALMRRVCGQYSRFLGKERPTHGSTTFARRYGSRIVAPEYLSHAVRRTHTLPVRLGFAPTPFGYPFSSDAAYRQARAPLTLDLTAVRHALDARGSHGRDGYGRFMQESDSEYITKLFEKGSPWDRRVVGGKVYVRQVHDQAAHPHPPLTRARLEAGVSTILRVGTRDRRTFACKHLSRSLVAWYGLRSGSANLVEMARWYSVTSASLGRAMHLYRQARADLFQLSTARFLEYALQRK